MIKDMPDVLIDNYAHISATAFAVLVLIRAGVTTYLKALSRHLENLISEASDEH